MNEPADNFEHRARAALESSIADLDEATRRRLRLARQNALLPRREISFGFQRMALAASLLLAVLWWVGPELQHTVVPTQNAETAMQLDGESFEVILAEDDPEFFVWLELAELGEDERDAG
jgi:hypothetical protein